MTVINHWIRPAVMAVVIVAMAFSAILVWTSDTITAQASRPAAPTGVSVTGGGNAGELDVSWDAHPDGAADYRVKWAPANGNFSTWSDTDWNAFPSGTSYTITGLDGGSEYKVQVKARFTGGPGSLWSAILTATATASTQNTPRPAALTNLNVTEGDNPGELDVSWDAHPDGAADHRVKWAPADGNFRTWSDTDWNAFPSGTSYTITGLDDGVEYKVQVKARFVGGPGSMWSAVVTATTRPANSTATGLPTITGTAQVGETLSADTSGISDANGLTNPQFTYQWVRSSGGTDTDISGATGQSYTLTSDDRGNNVKVSVSFTDDDGYSETLTSAAIATVSRRANAAAIGQPTITGTAQVGETLSAETSGISDANGLTAVQFTYQWVRSSGVTDTNISGATGQSYTLTSDDQGNTVKVTVLFADDDGYAETLTSAATGTVSPRANVAATGLPTITGTAQVGETLSADTSGISDDNGLANVQFTYQWIRTSGGTDADISGATGQTYTLTSDDQGNTIKVTVSFADDDGYSETLTSAATGFVATLTVVDPTADTPASQLQQQQSPAQSSSESKGQDFASDNTTTGWLVVGTQGATGNLGTASDVDAFKINLDSGKRYRIDVVGDGPRDFAEGGTYAGDVELMVRTLQDTVDTSFERVNGFGTKNPSDTSINNVVNIGSGPDGGAWSVFNVMTTGTYLVKVISDASNTGTYTVRASEITSEQAFGDFTSQWNSGRIKIDDTAAMTGAISDSSDSDWYKVTFEAGKCYSIQVKGQHSNQAHNGGTLSDPKVKVMNFYDYYHQRFYDPHTLAYVGVPAMEQTVEYYDETYINPSTFELLNRADKSCNVVRPSDQPDSTKLVCNYYCDDDSGQGSNSLIKVQVSSGGEGDYVIGVEGQGSTGTYSVFAKEITCPSN